MLEQEETHFLKCPKRFRFPLCALLHDVALALLHGFHPGVDRLLLLHRLDLRLEALEGHVLNAVVVVALHKLLVAVVVRRPQQLAGQSATVDHLEVALRRLQFHRFNLKEMIQVVGQNMVYRRLLGIKRQVPRHREIERCGTGTFPRLVPHHHDVALRLFQNQTSDLEELVGSRRRGQATHQRVKRLILRIQVHLHSRLKGLLRFPLARPAPLVAPVPPAETWTIPASRPAPATGRITSGIITRPALVLRPTARTTIPATRPAPLPAVTPTRPVRLVVPVAILGLRLATGPGRTKTQIGKSGEIDTQAARLLRIFCGLFRHGTGR